MGLALDILVESVPHILSGFETKTGRFLPNKLSNPANNKGIFSIYDQSLHYPLALLYKTKSSRNPFYKDKKILSVAIKGASYLKEVQAKNGSFRLVSGGADLGYFQLNWQVYHWLCTFE